MNYEHILFEISGAIARLTLNRPDRLNSFNTAMHAEVRDALARLGSNTTGKAVGLRGGTIDIALAPDGSRLTLHDVLWTNDLRVSGSVMSPGRSGNGVADVVVAGPDGMNGELKIRWTEGIARARAEVRGTFDKAAVVAETSAP